LLTERGLFSSRTSAAASVMAGEVLVGRRERRAEKPGELVDIAEVLTVAERRSSRAVGSSSRTGWRRRG